MSSTYRSRRQSREAQLPFLVRRHRRGPANQRRRADADDRARKDAALCVLDRPDEGSRQLLRGTDPGEQDQQRRRAIRRAVTSRIGGSDCRRCALSINDCSSKRPRVESDRSATSMEAVLTSLRYLRHAWGKVRCRMNLLKTANQPRCDKSRRGYDLHGGLTCVADEPSNVVSGLARTLTPPRSA